MELISLALSISLMSNLLSATALLSLSSIPKQVSPFHLSRKALFTKSPFVVCALNSSPDTKTNNDVSNNGTIPSSLDYPSGEFEYEKPSSWMSFVVKLRMLLTLPWQRVKKGSVLTMKLRGQVCIR